ncbi:O-methyltransferase [Halobacillus litoralis]|uniref:O-methyltransferase n=1 Tax=Halobacillus litoralis TaxID=45668 RepID=UPI001CD5AADA|nr:O-methyltransferase [Halobacillus litoralis]MCA0971956.1 O-methyltransferase [Halobacillus litoralis]
MSTDHTWKAFDQYAFDQLFSEDPVLNEVLKTNAEEGLPSIDVSPAEGKMLHLLASLSRAKNILEIGTLGGYSTIWLSRALPEDGQLVSLEYSEKHAEVARRNLKNTGLHDKVDVIVGPALDSFPKLPEKGFHDFDFVFIDADKKNNPHYIKEALKLSHPGTCIVVDNIVRDGKVLEKNSDDSDVQGIRSMFDFLSGHESLDATAIQTVGSKGYDGFLLAIVK